MGLFLRLIVWLQTIQLIWLIYETYTSIVIYAHYFSDEKGKFDELVEDKGVKILIDPKALMHVIGTKMDFIDDPLRYGYFNMSFFFFFFCKLPLVILCFVGLSLCLWTLIPRENVVAANHLWHQPKTKARHSPPSFGSDLLIIWCIEVCC